MRSQEKDAASKVSANPFVHISKGAENLFQTNLMPLLAVLGISALAGILFSLSFYRNNPFFVKQGTTAHLHFPVGILAATIVLLFIDLYVSLVIYRLVLKGSRREKVGIVEALSFAGHRYLITLLLYAALVGMVIVPAAAAGISGALGIPALALIFGLAAFIVIVVLAFRACYLFLISVDDEPIQSVRWAIGRSAALWKRSRAAVLLYLVTFAVIALVISAIASGIGGAGTRISTTTHEANGTTLVTTATKTPPLTFVITSVADSALILVLGAGYAEIYNQARFSLGN